MTHILVLYDGETGQTDNLPQFLDFIQSLRYEHEGKTYDVSPRLLIPMNLRVCDKVKDRLLEDLKMFINNKQQDKIDRLPIQLIGLKKVKHKSIKAKNDINKYKHKDLPRGALRNVHIQFIGELEDAVNPYGEEDL